MSDVVRSIPATAREAGSSLLLRWAVALVLLFAAYMKWEQLPVIGRMGEGLAYSPWFLFAQIVLEFVLALWLLSGVLPLWSRRAAIAAFTLFAIVTAYKALAGEASCGCFGQFQVNPWITLALDLTILAGLACKCLDHPLRWRHADTQHRPAFQQRLRVSVPLWLGSPHSRLGFGMAGLALVVSLTLWRMPAMAALPAPGGITFASGLAILEPEKWPGRPLPILDYLEGDKSDLASGAWSLIIYSNDCDHCRQFVPQAVAEATSSGAQYAFVELPPFAPAGAELIPVSAGLKLLRLSDKQEWFAQTPIVMQMENGRATTDPRSMEMPPVYMHSRVLRGETTWDKYRRQAEHDDHSEAYPPAHEGPNLYYSLNIPPGLYILSFYNTNKDGHTGDNRLRDYRFSVRSSRSGYVSLDGFNERPELASARQHDFWGGTYKRFLVRGPSALTIEIARNGSYSTINAGIFLDEALTEQPDPYFPKSAGVPPALSSDLLLAELSALAQRNPAQWATCQPLYTRLLRSYMADPESRQSPAAATCYFQSHQFVPWEALQKQLGLTTAREIEKALRWDQTTFACTGKGRQFVQAYVAAMAKPATQPAKAAQP